jgi:hypothetical protein
MRPGVRIVLLGFALTALLVTVPLSASAGPSNGGASAPTAAGWVNFTWDESGIAGPFDYTTEGAVYLDVTDSFCRGDQFSISDNGVEIGTTTSVPLDPECDDVPFLSTPIMSWKDPTYSKGEFLLEPGSHSLVITAIVNPFGSGGAFFGAWPNPAP